MTEDTKTALVIGAGPAGLMAAEVLARAGVNVTIADQMPSPARKFLMAGKSGLNLTKAEEMDPFCAAFGDVSEQFAKAIRAFGPVQVQSWAKGLQQEVFTGSTGRVFPVAMKASPLLRALLARLGDLGVVLQRRWQWTGWDNGIAQFKTPDGPTPFPADATILAMGGGSWRKLGSDGKWAAHLLAEVVPFEGANLGIRRSWTPFMERHFGQPIKSIALMAGDEVSRGEIVISKDGIEGGGIYSLTPILRTGVPLSIDLVPDVTMEQIRERQAARRKGETLARFLKSALHLPPPKIALFQELVKSSGASDPVGEIKSLPLAFDGFAPMDQAISTAGGLRFDVLDNWMLRNREGVFAAGEMLDWEAPTGGYLITGCLATGRAAGQAALDWMGIPAPE